MSLDLLGALAIEAERLCEDCDYSAKGHFESARLWSRWNLGIGVPSVLLAATAGVSALQHNPLIAAALAAMSAAATAILTLLKPAERASSHQKAGALYSSARNRARFFKDVELKGGQRNQALRKKLKELTEERNALNEASPEILRPAFEIARRGILAGESRHAVDSSRSEGAP